MKSVTFAAAGLLVAFTGCTVGPDYVRPDVATPDRWHQEIAADLQAGDAPLETWWLTLDDEQLNGLIRQAGRHNMDLRLAVASIAEASATRGVAAGDHWPDIDGTGSVVTNRNSEDLAPAIAPGQSRVNGLVALGLDSSWELDVWGRIRRSVESADARVEASVEAYRDVLVLLYASVAQTYIDMRTTQERLRLAQANVKLQRDTLRLVQTRFDAELVPELDLQQAKQNLARTEAILPDLMAQEDQLLHRLAVLLGEYPLQTRKRLTPAPVPQAKQGAVVLMPADLLRQRPDIRTAERSLASQTARIGVAEADLYPRFSLTGSFAFEATTGSFQSVFRRGNLAWTFGPTVRWNVFDGSRVRSQIDVEDARTEQALIQYEQTILVAVQETEDALSAYHRQIKRREALRRSAAAATKTVELVDVLYRNGLTDFQNVLDSQRTLVEAQDALAVSDGQVSRNLVAIYRAMGGGWAIDRDASTQKSDQAEDQSGEEKP